MAYHSDFEETFPLATAANKSKNPVPAWADLAARVIRQDICDRRGLKHEMTAIDADVQTEIMAVWGRIIDAAAFAGPVKEALSVIEHYGGIDGEHHKTWVIDQVVRALLGDLYAAWVTAMKDGEDGPNTYGWDEGIAP
jgi:hypothetical protein